ncbi:MAG: hypothetical protein D6711_16205 [Chloroflexi bacterium]|nr:MAG: hypothetical protein D6711_16205 [Chloroflexota bacterium]
MIDQRIAELKEKVAALKNRALREDITDAASQLEQEARRVLADAKNTPYEAEAQALFTELARLHNPTTPQTATIRGLLRRARIRIEIAGDDEDIDEAIDILTEALALNPAYEETIALLQDAAAQTPQAAQRVQDLFNQYGVERSATRQTNEAVPPPDKSPQTTTVEPAHYTSPTNDVETLLSELTQAYYSGEYQQTVELANRVLTIQPNNPTAKDYREKAEDNMIRGVVPDHRIPFDARVSYNRANSLVRAGNYEEAERLYREARDLAERAGILSWKDVEQAMLDIQDLALARELLNEGDRLMATDSWSDALRKYEGALRVVPNDPQAEERVEMVRRLQQDTEQAAAQLSTLSGSLAEQASQVKQVLATLARARQLLPGSQRLAAMQAEANNRLAAIKTQVNDQVQSALTRVSNATSIDEKLMLSQEAARLLEVGLELDPGDQHLSELMMQARSASSEMQRAKQTLERASAMIAQNFDSELMQARTMLAELSGNAQDERYRLIVNDLFSRFMERAEIALEEGDISEAQTWIETMREEPFRMLGRRAELLRLENQIRRERTRGRLYVVGVLFSIMIVLGAMVFVTRDAWQPIINPPPSNTPTITPTPSDTPTVTLTFTPTATSTASVTPSQTPTATWTVTPSLTITPSETPTHTLTPTHTSTPTSTPTPTATPTITNTPTITPTPPELCRVTVPIGSPNVNVRAEPRIAAPTVGLLQPGFVVDVLQLQPDETGRVWYQIAYQIGEAEVRGWSVATNFEQFGTRACPELSSG